ncbi:hypothetical protein EJD97_004920 [Solanum chilense]|uniref:Tf2-1-like SH3-like domain-containing protein n=1 Tax=Solanum chilense TaxID=4083 RepID=A0A6N2CH39_SOLCI|nr:hypothetical protein EJD97_004920 [Solanum chilense]
MKGVMRLSIKGKLSPRYVSPYGILELVRKVAYELKLPNELSPVHHVFHVSILDKYTCVPISSLPLEGLGVNENLSYEEIPVMKLDSQVRKLRNKDDASVKVQWRNYLVEADMKSRYYHLFPLTPNKS